MRLLAGHNLRARGRKLRGFGLTGQLETITADTLPSLGALANGQTPADAFTSGTYTSTAGTISSEVAEASINGGAYSAANMSTTLAHGDTVAVREVVTDSAANERTFAATGSPVQVPWLAPSFSVAASDSLAGRTLTVNPGTVAGAPIPALSIAMTLDGSPVTPSGSGPWTYVVPSSASAQTVAWTVTATNIAGTADRSGSEVVAADYILPTWTVSLGAISDGQTVGIPGSGADVEATLGGSAGAPNDPLTWEYTINGGTNWFAYSTPILAGEGEQIAFRISDTDHPAGAFSATSNTVTVSAAGAGIGTWVIGSTFTIAA